MGRLWELTDEYNKEFGRIDRGNRRWRMLKERFRETEAGLATKMAMM